MCAWVGSKQDDGLNANKPNAVQALRYVSLGAACYACYACFLNCTG